ncbi:hypothetical protein ZIOFF_070555 [Zingiber officinale]|uniref:Protein kinase domain-containing protein n=1 Tax=Zingiber officinale TaxID=94328 RepID=A0A8J5BZ28_ZINOF|nr:hypothetical protein ZIOFF_070555 [Zingiber officinale]
MRQQLGKKTTGEQRQSMEETGCLATGDQLPCGVGVGEKRRRVEARAQNLSLDEAVRGTLSMCKSAGGRLGIHPSRACAQGMLSRAAVQGCPSPSLTGGRLGNPTSVTWAQAIPNRGLVVRWARSKPKFAGRELGSEASVADNRNSHLTYLTALKDQTIMNWVIANQSCKDASKDNATFACIYENSSCLDVKNEGYRCICKHGYDGNPYLPFPDGCQDINECNSSSKVCTGDCINTNGSFYCICPQGTSGDPVRGECLPNKRNSLLLETEVPLLIYEFISNGTLSDHLHVSQDESKLSWDDRLRIASESAGALAYLHSAASMSVFHRDVKSSNILLDDTFKAKVSDFGASRFIPLDQTHIVTVIHGTFGYIDPEYYQTSQLTAKSDVYSFGIILLELLTGKKPIFSTKDGLQQNLAMNFLQATRENMLLDLIEDRVLQEGTKQEFLEISSLIEICLNLKGAKRPTMKEVEYKLQSMRKGKAGLLAQPNNQLVVAHRSDSFVEDLEAGVLVRGLHEGCEEDVAEVPGLPRPLGAPDAQEWDALMLSNFALENQLHTARQKLRHLCIRLITAKDHASVQINIGHLDDNGVYTGQYTTFALSGFIRAQIMEESETSKENAERPP